MTDHLHNSKCLKFLDLLVEIGQSPSYILVTNSSISQIDCSRQYRSLQINQDPNSIRLYQQANKEHVVPKQGVNKVHQYLKTKIKAIIIPNPCQRTSNRLSQFYQISYHSKKSRNK